MTRMAACKRLAAAIGLGAALLSSTAAAQQREWLNPDVTALREEVQQLRAEVARLSGGAAPLGVGVGAGVAAAPSGDVYTRLDQVEAELRRLVGEVEKLTFRQDELRRQMGLGGGAAVGGIPAAPSGLQLQPQAAAPAGDGVLGVLPAGEGGAIIDTPKYDGQIIGAGDGAATPAPGAPLAEAAPTPAPTPTADPAALQEGLDLLRRNQIEAAADRFQAFIAGAPTDPRVGDATYWLGETYFVRGDFGRAAQNFLSVYRDHGQSNRAPDSLLKLGMSLARLDKQVEACRTLAAVATTYPNASPTTLRRAELELRNTNCP